ncbi:unnamed protein product [Heterosigma akashiwo]
MWTALFLAYHQSCCCCFYFFPAMDCSNFSSSSKLLDKASSLVSISFFFLRSFCLAASMSTVSIWASLAALTNFLFLEATRKEMSLSFSFLIFKSSAAISEDVKCPPLGEDIFKRQRPQRLWP